MIERIDRTPRRYQRRCSESEGWILPDAPAEEIAVGFGPPPDLCRGTCGAVEYAQPLTLLDLPPVHVDRPVLYLLQLVAQLADGPAVRAFSFFPSSPTSTGSARRTGNRENKPL